MHHVIAFITHYSSPACFDRRRDNPKSNLQTSYNVPPRVTHFHRKYMAHIDYIKQYTQ
jgi:hypothetical protein